MFKWNKYFEEVGKPNFYKNFGVNRDKIIVVKNKNGLKNFFN